MNTSKLLFAMAAVIGLAGCGDKPPPPSATLDSGITSSNGGGQRALGNLPDVTVGQNGARTTMQPRDPRVPTY